MLILYVKRELIRSFWFYLLWPPHQPACVPDSSCSVLPRYAKRREEEGGVERRGEGRGGRGERGRSREEGGRERGRSRERGEEGRGERGRSREERR